MRSVQTQGFAQSRIEGGSPASVAAKGTVTGSYVRSRRRAITHPSSCSPFAPPALPGFFATMGALTPGGRLFVPTPRAMNTVLCRPGLLVSCIQPSDRSASNHLLPSPDLDLVWTRSLPHGLPTVSLSGPWRQLGFTIRWRLATTTSRIEFVILRTSLSPPVALHPLSRGRSFCRLRNSDPTPTRTFTLLIRYTHKRTTATPTGRQAQGTNACRHFFSIARSSLDWDCETVLRRGSLRSVTTRWAASSKAVWRPNDSHFPRGRRLNTCG